jgi:hypothetical protein
VGLTYEGGRRFFRWSGDLSTGRALFEADFGAGKTTLSAGISLLSAENSLGEAMFF